jgi:hypothetical protein
LEERRNTVYGTDIWPGKERRKQEIECRKFAREAEMNDRQIRGGCICIMCRKCGRRKEGMKCMEIYEFNLRRVGI